MIRGELAGWTVHSAGTLKGYLLVKFCHFILKFYSSMEFWSKGCTILRFEVNAGVEEVGLVEALWGTLECFTGCGTAPYIQSCHLDLHSSWLGCQQVVFI